MSPNDRSGPIGGDCDKGGCKRAAYRRVGAVKTCGDHEEWAQEWYESDEATGTLCNMEGCLKRAEKKTAEGFMCEMHARKLRGVYTDTDRSGGGA